MQKTRHVIIDTETLDVTPSAVLLTIGAVAVEISGGKAIILGSWYRRLQWETVDLQPGRTTSASTAKWWQAQSETAFNEAVNGAWQRIPLWLAMHSLQAWLALNNYPIWGNGADFDNAQMQHAFTQLDLRWPYRRNRCLRSLRGLVLDLYPDTKLPAFPAHKIKHHALHDAEHEADVLAVLLNTLEAPWLELGLKEALNREHSLLATASTLTIQRSELLNAQARQARALQALHLAIYNAARNDARLGHPQDAALQHLHSYNFGYHDGWHIHHTAQAVTGPASTDY